MSPENCYTELLHHWRIWDTAHRTPFFRAVLTYWAKLIAADDKSLIKRVRVEINKDIDKEKFSKTWRWRIMTLLNGLKLQELWNNQENAHKLNYQNLINTRLKSFREQWIDSAKIVTKV